MVKLILYINYQYVNISCRYIAYALLDKRGMKIFIAAA